MSYSRILVALEQNLPPSRGEHDAAWTEMTKVFSDLVGSISRNLKQNTERQMELLDEAKKPLFYIRLVAETLE
jgi:hypothetical protein